ncbi:MAG TPA: hypothetical protein VKQ32_15575, partial [Polyangia bacterium]|nr:hypothetical protein [Polyangia bacterium]
GKGGTGGSVGGSATGGSSGKGGSAGTGGTGGAAGGGTGGTGGAAGGGTGGSAGRGGSGGSAGTGAAGGGSGGTAGGSGGTAGGSGGTGGTGGSPVAPGTILWARSLSQSYPTGAIESGSGVLVTAFFFSPIDVGAGTTYVPAGDANTVIADFAVSDAHHIYSVPFGGGGQAFGFVTGASSGNAIVDGVSYCDPGANPPCTGNDLGKGTVQGGGGPGADGFVARWMPSSPAWVRRLVGPGDDKLIASALGPPNASDDTVYVGGWFDSGSTTLDGLSGNLPWAGDRDILIAQYDAFSGAFLWAKTFGSPSRDELSAIAFKGSSLFLAGVFGRSSTDSLTLGTTTLNCAGDDDVWAGKFMPDGTPVWAVRFGGTMDDRGARLAVDAAGDVYLAGIIHDQVVFGTKTWVSAGGGDIFVVKLRGSDGGVLWSTAFGDVGDDEPTGILVDAKGDLVVSGTITGPIETNGPFGGATDAFVVAFDPANGNRRWSKMIGGTGADNGGTLSAGVGALYVTVGTGGAIDLGTPIIGEANPTGLVLKMQP